MVDIWADLRIEAMQKMFGFGKADLMLLADPSRQLELLNSFLHERPHLEFPQPRGQTVPDTLQAIWQAYSYLGAVGSEVLDRETDRARLKADGRDILTRLTAKASALRTLWTAHYNAIKAGIELPELPQTIFEILFEDITAKTKSIALSCVFGPEYESNMHYVEELVRSEGRKGDVGCLRTNMAMVLLAKDPDEVRGIRFR